MRSGRCVSKRIAHNAPKLPHIPSPQNPGAGCGVILQQPSDPAVVISQFSCNLSVLCLRDAKDATRSCLPAYEERTGSSPTVHGGVRPTGEKRSRQKETDDANRRNKRSSESSRTSRGGVASIEGAGELTPEGLVRIVCHARKAFYPLLVKGLC
jgi:hypothetical protein